MKRKGTKMHEKIMWEKKYCKVINTLKAILKFRDHKELNTAESNI